MLLSCGESSGSDGLVYQRLGTGSGSAVAVETSDAVEAETAYDPDALYMIENIDSVEEHIIVRDLDTRRLYRYSYGLNTAFTNKHGGHSLLTDFHPGLVVTIGELDSEGKLKEIRLSDKAFVMEDVKNYSIDTSRNLFSIGQTNYELNDEAEIFSGDAISDLTAITENDALRVVGIDKKIVSLSITTGHGYLFVTNTGTFSDTLMQIGSKIFIKVDPTDMTIEIPEGTYAVTVAKDGYGGTKEVTVGRGETVNLNLDELKGEGPKTSQITFSVGVDDAHIYLDGQEVPTGGAMTVKYGRHALKVTAEGYDDSIFQMQSRALPPAKPIMPPRRLLRLRLRRARARQAAAASGLGGRPAPVRPEPQAPELRVPRARRERRPERTKTATGSTTKRTPSSTICRRSRTC